MGKYDGVLICSDFDGTLAWQTKVGRDNAEAIRFFQENGGKFTIVSGRYPKSVIEFCGEAVRPNAYICGMNGVCIAEPVTGIPVYESFLDSFAYAFCRKVVSAFPQIRTLCLHTDRGEICINAENGVPGSAPESDFSGIYKCLFIVDEADSDQVSTGIAAMTDGLYTPSRSWINGIEFQRLGEDKGSALMYLKSRLNADVTYGVGDYENDIPLIEAADVGCAVGNAVGLLRAAADRVLPDCRDGAIAELIYSI
jgi:hydroxymethylpyrimidine pyrophosphatase-like HAD family hydrolase